MSAPPPPRPAPKPGRVKVYRALYDYTARSDALRGNKLIDMYIDDMPYDLCHETLQDQEMSFLEGDLIYVTDGGPNEDWLKASCGKNKGLVPANYVVGENVEQLPNPLHEAAKRGNVEFLQECLENQVSVNSLDKSGSTALYWASHGGHVEVLQILLATPNISVSTQNKIGDTPLHAASWRGHSECVRLLLAAGANPRIRNQQRKLPLDEAKDAETAALLDTAMKANINNVDEPNEYESNSDEEQ